MSESYEVEEFVEETIVSQKSAVARDIIDIVSAKYDVMLKSSDVAFIENVFIKFLMKSWRKESEEKVNEKVNSLKTRVSELIEFIEVLGASDEFKSVPILLRTESYERIVKDKELFSEIQLSNAYNEILLFTKSLIKNIQEFVGVEQEFFEILISVIRNSDRQFENLVRILKFKELSESKISLNDVISLIASNNFSIQSYQELQNIASKLDQKTLILNDIIKQEITSYIKPIERRVVNEKGLEIMRIKGKIVFFDEEINFFASYKEIHIICDVLHIYKNASTQSNLYRFNIDNLILVANIIKVHDQVTIDLSGNDGEIQIALRNAFKNTFKILFHLFFQNGKAREILKNETSNSLSKPGRDSNGVGISGEDGFAGESGGNISIDCAELINPQNLTLKSNGGNGTNGQDGGDGKDGEDGEDVYESDIKTNLFPPYISRTGHNGFPSEYYEYKRTCCTVETSIIIVYGTDGKPGTNGGLGGLGGEGGYGGEILVDVKDGHDESVQIFNNNGKTGANGINGENGLTGKEGRDIWAIAHFFWLRKIWYYGFDKKYKYRFENRSENCSLCCWVDPWNTYVTVVEDRPVRTQSTLRERATSHSIRSRAKHARALRKKSTYKNNFKSQYSNLISSSLDSVNREAKKYKGIEGSLKKSKIKNKVKTTYKISYNEQEFEEKNAHAVSNEGLNFENFKKEISERFYLSAADFVFRLKKADLTTKECVELKKMMEVKYSKYWETISIIDIDNEEFFNRRLSKEFVKFIWDVKISLLEFKENYANFFVEQRKIFYGEIAEEETDEPEKIFESSFNFLSDLFSSPETVVKTIIDKITPQSNEVKLDVPKQIKILIPYLTDTKEFDGEFRVKQDLVKNVHFATLNHYFNSDEAINRTQIDSFFKELKKIKEDEPSFVEVEGIFIKMLDFFYESRSELNEIEDSLTSMENEYKNIIKPLIASKSAQLEDKIKVHKFLKNFFEDLKISKFIEQNIEDYGVKSPIYRTIVAFLFNIDLRIFVKNFDGTISLGEEQLFSDENKIEINLLMRKKEGEKLHFTLLKFDMARYVIDQERKHVAKKSLQYVYNWKIDQKLSENDLILKNFILFKIENRENLVWAIMKNFTEIENESKKNVKFLLNEMVKTDAVAILQSMKLRLFYEQNTMTVEEFEIILDTVFLMIEENPFMIEYFTVKFLALDHKFWIVEIILLEIENYLKIVDVGYMKVWRNILERISYREILVLFHKRISDLEEGEMTLNTFDEVLQTMQFFSNEQYSVIVNVKKLSAWKHVITSDYWFKEYSFLKKESEIVQIISELQSKLGSAELKKFFKLLDENSDEIENIQEQDFLKNLLLNFNTGEWALSQEVIEIIKSVAVKNWINEINLLYSTQGVGERTIDQIVKLVHENSKTSESTVSIKNDINIIGAKAKEILAHFNAKFKNYSKYDVNSWLENRSPMRHDYRFEDRYDNFEDRFAIVLRVFQLELGILLRNTQIISVLTLWENGQDVLLQVSTGEGKTFVGVAFAVLKFLNNEKVHIITSSSVLAQRDAEDEENSKIFNVFGMTVGHNCHNNEDDRRRAYLDCHVVYGVLSNFQRDLLLTEFYDMNFLTRDQLQNVLVDEVDSILLDKGNNILYLSQDIPGIGELESAFIFIWQWFNQEFKSVDEAQFMLSTFTVRNIFLDNLFGVIYEEDLKKIFEREIQDKDTVKRLCSSLIVGLKKEKLISEENYFLIKSLKNNREDLIVKVVNSLEVSEEIKYCVKTYILRKLNSPKPIQFPRFFNDFVLHHLDNWIKSAANAMMMEEGTQYVLDRTRDGATITDHPNILIIDVDTGTDLANSEWDEGLCQFLQLKHGCSISPLSLKSVFISNVTYFNSYKKKYGMTGTLGSKSECEKIKKFYNLDYATIPTFKPKRFTEYLTLLAKSSEEWLDLIFKEVEEIFEKERSCLVICNTIKDIHVVHDFFKKDPNKKFNETNMRIYQRDYEKFNIGKLKPRQLIIATNLAGRGTDIKLSQELANNGGLHVILTFLPANIRIENQAFGRSARAGQKGSARLIFIQADDDSDIGIIKGKRNQRELTRLESVSEFYTKFIKNEEGLFSRFLYEFKTFKSAFSDDAKKKKLDKIGSNIEKILCDNLKVSWALWLDLQSKLIEKFSDNRKTIENSLYSFLHDTANSEYVFNHQTHPILKLDLAKGLIRAQDCEEMIKWNGDKDFLAYSYYENFAGLRKNTNLKHRDLSKLEIKRIRRNILEIERYQSILINRKIFIQEMKKKFKSTLIDVKGFEKQIDDLMLVYNIFNESLKKMLGSDVTTETFDCEPFRNPIFSECFYNYLLDKDYITSPEIEKDDSAIEKLANKYFISPDSLMSFLQTIRISGNKFMEDFADALQNDFTFMSRESFWEILMEKEILVSEVKYALIDLKTIREFLPYEEATIKETFKSIGALSADFNAKEIFLIDQSEFNEQIKLNDMLAITLNRSIENMSYFKFLVKNKIVSFNSKASFNINRYDELKDSFIFKNLNYVTKDDFDFIELNSVKTKIFNKLIELNVLKLISRSNSKYYLSYEKLRDFYLDSQFDENLFYKEKVFNLLKEKFPMQVALEHLAFKIRQNDDSESTTIQLYSKPHLLLMQDLIGNFLIIPSKVNPDKYQHLEDDQIFKKSMSFEYVVSYLKGQVLKSGFKLSNDIEFSELILELTSKGFLEKNGSEFSIKKLNNDLKLSDKFEKIESSVRVMLNQKRLLVENKNKIIETYKDCLEQLKNKDIDEPSVVLVPLETYYPKINVDLLRIMQYNGFNSVIKVEETKYTLWYYLKMAAVIIAGIVQIAIGATLMIVSSGGGYYVGQAFLSEGISDIIYSLSTLRTGVFKWKDYLIHKAISISVSAITAGISFKMASPQQLAAIGKFGNKIGVAFAGQTFKETLKNTTLAVKKQILLQMAKTVGKEVIKNGVKAVAMAGVQFAVEELVEKVLDGTTLNFSEQIAEYMAGDFNKHEISKTIGKLYDEQKEKAEELIMGRFKNVLQADETFRNILSTVGDKADNIVNAFTSSKNSKVQVAAAAVTSIVVKSVNMGLVITDIVTIFDELNAKLKDDIKPNAPVTPSNQEKDKFISKIKKLLEAELSQRLKAAINQNIISPALNYAGNRAVNAIGKYTFNKVSKSYVNHKEYKDKKEAISTIKNHEKLQQKKDLTIKDVAYMRKLENKIQNIKARTKNPETYASLMNLDLPMGIVELEAAARNLNRKIIVIFEGREHVFGKSDTEPLAISLKDGHFPNSSDGSPKVTNDCLYRALKDHIDLGDMTASDFRKKISETIVKNPEVRTFVTNTNKKFFSNIKFYGGNEDESLQKVNDKKNTDKFVQRKVYGVAVNVDTRVYDSRANKYKTYSDNEHESYNKAIATGMREILKTGSDLVKAKVNRVNPPLKNINLFEFDDFDVKTVAPIYSNFKDDKNRPETAPQNTYALPVEMILNSERFGEKINRMILDRKEAIDFVKKDLPADILQKLRRNNIPTTEQKINEEIKALQEIRDYTASKIINLNFDHVTVESAKGGKQRKENNGPNTPHVGLAIGNDAILHRLIPQFETERVNGAFPTRVQNNEVNKEEGGLKANMNIKDAYRYDIKIIDIAKAYAEGSELSRSLLVSKLNYSQTDGLDTDKIPTPQILNKFLLSDKKIKRIPSIRNEE